MEDLVDLDSVVEEDLGVVSEMEDDILFAASEAIWPVDCS